MTLHELTIQLDSLGIQLWLEAGELRFKAPQGVFTPELREQVKAQREALINHLQAIHSPQRDDANAYSPFPLTEVQSAYLIGRTGAYANGNTACHGYAEFRFNNPHDFTAQDCQQAWQKVVQAHPMLKVRISAEGWQHIDESIDVPLHIETVTEKSDFASAQQQIREQLRHKQYTIENPPYFNIVLIDGEEEKSLHLSVDLILTDFLGLQTLLNDFIQALRFPNQNLSTPSLSFRDYLAYQQKQQDSPLGQQRKAQALSYWKEQVAQLPPAMILGGRTMSENNQATAQYRRRAFILPSKKWQVLNQQIRNAGLTPNALALAILARVARRYGNSAQSTITATLLDRMPICEDVGRIVGDFTSTLLLTIDGGKDSLLERAHRIQNTLFTALEHRALSGMEISRLYERETGNKQTFSDVVVTSTIGASIYSQESPLENDLTLGLSQTPQVLLDVQLSDHQQDLAIVWDSREGGFPEAVLDSAFQDFTQAFNRLCEEPEYWQYDILPRHSLVLPSLPSTSHQTLLQDWLSYVKTQPHHIAIIHGDKCFSHSELLQKARQYRDYLYAQKLQAGDAVFIQLPMGFSQIAAQIGTLLAGGVFVPISPHAPTDRIAAMHNILEQTRPQHHCHYLDQDIIGPETDAEDYNANVEEIAYIIFTSGSTGTPKGVPITHQQAMNTLCAMQEMLALNHQDKVFALSQPTFDLAIFNVFSLLKVGGSIVIPQDSTGLDANAWLEDLHKHSVTIWNSVPAQMQLLLEVCEREASSLPTALRAALLSGDWIPVQQPQHLAKFAPQCRFIALGGATEAAIWSNYHFPSSTFNSNQASIPYGRALHGQAMHIVNEDLEEAVYGQIGEIMISGASVSNGYLGAPNQAFFTHPDTKLQSFLTGDRGRYLPNGEIEFLGRKDNQIKLRGYRIELGEIEAVLKSLPEVEDAIAFVDNQQLYSVIKAKSSVSPLSKGISQKLSTQHKQFLHQLDQETFLDMFKQINEASYCAMCAILQGNINPAPGHLALLKRWKKLLNKHSIEYNNPSLEQAQHLLTLARPLGDKIYYGKQQLDYIEQCIIGLTELVEGKLNPLSLLFPEGEMDVANASYADNLINRHLNELLVSIIEEYAKNLLKNNKKLRLLEIGGGVGATTQVIIPLLEKLSTELALDYDYTFTDISDYFLNNAKRRWPQLHCQQFNLNQDFQAQGFAASSFDIVICANVLHNANHIPKALDAIHTLLVPEGILAAIDASRPNAPLMITMEFKEGLTDFTDERASREEVFFDYTDWQNALANSAFTSTHLFPDEDNPQYNQREQAVNQAFHQVVILAQKHRFSDQVQPFMLVQQLQTKLPAYMIPSGFTILPQLPLTINGKIDRKQLQNLLVKPVNQSLSSSSFISKATTSMLNEAQQQVAAIWREVLNLGEETPLNPEDNFFALGGDSLLLARCIGILRKRITRGEQLIWDSLLREIVAKPTLAHCTQCFFPNNSHFLETAKEAEPSSPLQLLLPAVGKRHDETSALILVHDGSGGIQPYRDVITAFAQLSERPICLGLIRTKDDGYLTLPAETLFEHLAERYVQAIVAAGYKQVYLLGYCMGGLIAAVMAERLLTRGIQVVNLSVISAYRIPFEVEDNVLLDYAFARLLGEDPAFMGLHFPQDELGALISNARHRFHEHLSDGVMQTLATEFPNIAAVLNTMPHSTIERLTQLANHSPTLSLSIDELLALREIYIASLRAVTRFNDSGYFGDITFLRQSGDIPFLPQLKADMSQFWQEYCLGTLNIRDISGNHFNCLTGSNGQAVAQIIAESWQ